MKKSIAVAGIVMVLAMLQAVAANSIEQFRVGDMAHGRFINETGVQVDGLLLIFEGPAEIQNWTPIAGYMAPDPGASSEIRFAGWLDPNGEIFIDWLADGPRLMQAAWLLEGEVVKDLCVACPSARILLDPGYPLVGEEVSFKSLSQDPYGSALVHEWEWEDGETAAGEAVTRTYATTGNHEVTLTVRNEEGLTDQETRRFSIFLEPQPPEPNPRSFTLCVSIEIEVYAGGQVPYPVGVHVYGPGIDIEFLLVETPDAPYVTLTWLADDACEEYPSGTSVTLTAEATSTGDVVALDSWLGCASCAGSTCTVVMDSDKAVEVTFSNN